MKTLSNKEFRMRKPLMIGNWKMNGNLAANETLLNTLLPGLDGLNGVEIVVCPPFPYLFQASRHLKDSAVTLGAQTLNERDTGANTGEVSAAMLQDFGCHYVLIGHSERRCLYKQSDTDTAAKFITAVRHKLVPVLCVGETLAERKNGATEAVVARQIQAIKDQHGVEAFRDSVIAYEPIWAIGTGNTATPEQVQAMHAFIRQLLAEWSPTLAEQIRLIYGGSINVDNAAALFAQPDVDGGLVGTASVDAKAFGQICLSASNASHIKHHDTAVEALRAS
jgi:triosephosphate isomerase